jgi:tetratricopeptide (TPR) repeat protein
MSSSLPFIATPSLESIIRSYPDDPEGAIRKLEARRDKHRTDPVVHIWLCWAYAGMGERRLALKAALRAQVQAPGSTLTAQLRYLCLHPAGFAAFDRSWAVSADPKAAPVDLSTHLDLDGIIQKLTHASASRIQPNQDDTQRVDMADESSKKGDIRTATMAAVHEKQGRLDEALAIYEYLSTIKPEAAATYAPHIERIKAARSQTD